MKATSSMPVVPCGARLSDRKGSNLKFASQAGQSKLDMVLVGIVSVACLQLVLCILCQSRLLLEPSFHVLPGPGLNWPPWRAGDANHVLSSKAL